MADKIYNFEVNSPRWLSLEDFDGEVWANTPFDNYMVSNYGRIKSIAHTTTTKRNGREYNIAFKTRIVKLGKNKGYWIFNFSQDRKHLCARIHRLVGISFVENPNNYPFINHKDENKANNIYTNIEWCDEKYNSNYGTVNKRRSSSITNTLQNKARTICQYNLNGELVHQYKGNKQIKEAGFTVCCVNKCCNHKLVIHKGFVWRYDNDPFSIDGDYKRKRDPCQVMQLDLEGNFIKTHESLTKAGKMFNKSGAGRAAIKACCEGKRKTAYAYKWKYLH